MKRWCRQKYKQCSMVNEYGYCQVTACVVHEAELMPICNDENAIMLYKTPKVNWNVDGMIPIEWLKTKTIGELCELLEEWENNKWPQ